MVRRGWMLEVSGYSGAVVVAEMVMAR